MSYIQFALQPYRGNLAEEIWEILKEDHERVFNYTEDRGLMFFITYELVMILSVLKVIYHIFDHFRKPERPGKKG